MIAQRAGRPAAEQQHGRPTQATISDLRACIDAIGYEPGEHLSVLIQRPGDEPKGRRMTPAALVALVERAAGINVWSSVTVVTPEGPRRGGAADVVRIPAIWADLDHAPNKLPTWDAVNAVVETLADLVEADPVYVTMTGHGLHPVWAIEPEDSHDVERLAPLLRRWQLLVKAVAKRHGGSADTVSDPCRVLRAVGSTNYKDPERPVPTAVEIRNGRPLSADELADVLDAYNVPEADATESEETVAPSGSWEWGTSTCAYVSAMVGSWAQDNPEARHPWAVSQATRLAAAHRLGCITQDDHAAAVQALTGRMAELCRRPSDPRTFTPDEITGKTGALVWGVLKVETFHEARAHTELGDHHRDDPPTPGDPADPDTWPTLHPLDDLGHPPEFPLDRLPAVVRDYVEVVAERVQIDPVAPALFALGVLATVAQKTAIGPGYGEPLALYALVMAAVSERKSPAHSALVAALHDVEQHRAQATAEARNLHNERRRLLEAQLVEARKFRPPRKGEAQAPPDPAAATALAAELDDLGPEQKPPRLVTDNVTLERLKGLMADNDGRLGVLSPEGSFLSILAGDYSGSGAADLAAVLSGYSGERIVVDRLGRAGESIPHPALTILVTGQPERLRDLAAVKGAEDRGLIDRFVIGTARSRAGTRHLSLAHTQPPTETPEGRAWAQVVAAVGDRPPLDSPPRLTLDDEGRQLFEDWHNDTLEPERAPGGRWARIPGFAGKAHGLALRFAGLAHLVEIPHADGSHPIPAARVADAIALAEWALLSHEHAVLGARVPEVVKRALRVVSAAQRGTLTGSKESPEPWAPFTTRDISRHLGKAGAPVHATAAAEVVELLADHGYVARSDRGYVWRPGLGVVA